jgi:hypothetical protein
LNYKIEQTRKETPMNFGEAAELQGVISEAREQGEIAEGVVTTLDLDELAARGGLGEIWRVIVHWPNHLKLVIRDRENWEHRKSLFIPKRRESRE